MKRKLLGFIGYCLAVCLMAVSIIVMASCSKTPASTPVHAPPIPSVPALTLSSITIVPNSPANLVVGSTQQFAAIGTYSNGSSGDISAQAIWSSSNSNVATISLAGSGGLATGVADGNSNITATLYGVTSPPVSLTVVAPTPTPSATTPTTSTTTTP